MTDIELKSSAFHDHAPIPPRHAREGDNVPPPLTWSGVPDDAAELVLLCEDPDAPQGTFVHWLMTGLDPRVEGLDAGAPQPPAHVHRNDFGEDGWSGPHPPAGDEPHRYFFRLYALPAPVSLPEDATADEVHAAVDRQHVGSGTLVGLYQR
ncbi:YbhB/YbcL family Raf kinase inhibitor-like protein [Streptomyces sp. NPDC059063]|uniref:YbhB/YbcL family Raf kinase inhibitor-like protein n=1 Tax=unclassified Streptomyces TaxID=2593676 RepID=UPI0036BE0954